MPNTVLVQQKVIQIPALDEFHCSGECFIITMNDAEDELMISCSSKSEGAGL